MYSADDDYGQALQEYEEYNEDGHDYYALAESPCEVLPITRLFGELMGIVEQIKNLVCLYEGWCLLLLKEFKWDQEYLRGEFFNHNDNYLQAIGYKNILDDPTHYRRKLFGECEVCAQSNTQLLFNICSHRYCLDCWMSHFAAKLQSSGPFMTCMGCEVPVLHETIVGMLRIDSCNQQWLNRYEKKLCELFSSTNRKYKLCTGIDCDNCIKINQPNLESVMCNCGKIFCFRCKSDDHSPCTCEQKEKWMQFVMKEEADAKWIAMNAKLCPWCKKAVERSAGCNYMACVCGKSFCYLCSKPWEPDHKDHFKCHIYVKKPDEAVNREKEVLERINHSTERYLSNQSTAESYRKTDLFSKRKLLFRVLGISLSESEFIENAFKYAIQCCEKTKWIYAFVYFSEMKSGEAQDRFDFAMGEFEKHKEYLLKKLAIDLRMFLLKVEKLDTGKEEHQVQAYEDFRDIKKDIVNYYTWTKKYQEIFVLEVKNLSVLEERSRSPKKKAQIDVKRAEMPMSNAEAKKATLGSKIVNSIPFVRRG